MARLTFAFALATFLSFLVGGGVGFTPLRRNLLQRRALLSSATPVEAASVVSISDSAMDRITGMEREGGFVHVRLGVRDGGCSGMSYAMQPCNANDVDETVRALLTLYYQSIHI